MATPTFIVIIILSAMFISLVFAKLRPRGRVNSAEDAAELAETERKIEAIRRAATKD
jgi:hypothetical protein